MGHLPNKARKEREDAQHWDAQDRENNGFTVFHFDFNPKLKRSNLRLGEAIRYLMRVTGTRITFWRCPVRGLAIRYQQLPRSSKAWDKGETWMILDFSQKTDVTEAKKDLVLNMLLQGIGLYRGLPNALYKEEVRKIMQLLTAPAGFTSAEEWLALKAQLQPRTQTVIDTHQPELRHHLLGKAYPGPTGPVSMQVRVFGT